MTDENINLNTNLYSIQIGVYGLQTMIKISKINVFIFGKRGINNEISK